MAREPRSAGDIRCRLLVTPPADGPWNMSVDEVLLQQAASGVWSLRFYAWQQPTLSLGYFQSCHDRHRHHASLACACVRRSTGGGAILHDQELTYSIAVPPGHRLAQRAEDLYRTVHTSLIGVLKNQLGITATLAEDIDRRGGQEPFLCFERRAGGDVIIGNSKVAGSAQRRWRGAVLQHGSILLRRSAWADELPGLDEFSSTAVSGSLLARSWQHHLAAAMGVSLSEAELTTTDLQLADEIASSRYSQVAWTHRR